MIPDGLLLGENGISCKLLIALASQGIPSWNRIVESAETDQNLTRSNDTTQDPEAFLSLVRLVWLAEVISLYRIRNKMFASPHHSLFVLVRVDVDALNVYVPNPASG